MTSRMACIVFGLLLGMASSALAPASASVRPRIESLSVKINEPKKATMRICAARGVIQLQLHEQFTGHGANPVILGEGSEIFVRQHRKRCQRHVVSWPEFEGTGGVGVHRIKFRVIDQTGRSSRTREYKYVVND